MKYKVMTWDEAQMITSGIKTGVEEEVNIYGIPRYIWQKSLEGKIVPKNVMDTAYCMKEHTVMVNGLYVPVCYIKPCFDSNEAPKKPNKAEDNKGSKFKVGDRVRVLDGRGINGYVGGFVSQMTRFVGKTYRVCKVTKREDGKTAYRLSDAYSGGHLFYLFDERGLELADRKPIVITFDHLKVTAIDKETGEKVEARCNPDDNYDYRIGSLLAVNRLLMK